MSAQRKALQGIFVMHVEYDSIAGRSETTTETFESDSQVYTYSLNYTLSVERQQNVFRYLISVFEFNFGSSISSIESFMS